MEMARFEILAINIEIRSQTVTKTRWTAQSFLLQFQVGNLTGFGRSTQKLGAKRKISPSSDKMNVFRQSEIAEI
jgi:hypothetical protein